MLITQNNQHLQKPNKDNLTSFINFLNKQDEGLKFKDLKYCNDWINYFIQNFKKNPDISFECISKFFEFAEKGFIKQKSFDEKLNFNQIVQVIKHIGKLASQININENLDYYQKKLIELNYQTLNFFQTFMKSKNLIRVDQNIKTIEISQKNKIEFLSTKRTQNLRHCEQIELTDFDDNKENSQFLLNSQNLQFNLKVFKQSQILIYLIEFVQKNSQILQDLCIIALSILNSVCQDQEICNQICSLGFCKDLLFIIYDNKDNVKNLISRISFEILWNQIHITNQIAIESILSENTLFIIKEIFCKVISNSYKMEDKTIRNELLVLINYLLDDRNVLKSTFKTETSDLLQNILEYDYKIDNLNQFPLVDILLYLCTIDEVIELKGKQNKNSRRYFELGNEDLICKKLIIHSISLVIKNSNSPILEKLIQNSYFIDTLFFYFQLYNGEELSLGSRYSIAQIKEIQSECLQALEILADKFDFCFFVSNRLILFLKYLRNSQDNNKLLSILKVFEKLSNKSEENKKKIVQKGTIDLLLYYINGCQRLNNLEDEEVLKIKTYSFAILANLCKNSSENQFAFAQKGGIDILLENLKNNLIMKTERSSLYVIKLFKTLNSCVFGNIKNEELFLENEGVYILMDFLENCLSIHWKQALSSLCQLMQNDNSLRYFDDWSSSKDQLNSTQLLIRIYKTQDDKFNVEYNKGILKNINQPLNPKIDTLNKKKGFKQLQNALQESQQKDNLKELIQNQNASNFNFESYLIYFLKKTIQKFDLRGQIYSILTLTGFDRNKINQDEKQRLEIIKKYKFLKIGEIWKDIKFQLEKKKIKPTEEDMNQIELKIDEMSDILNICLENQKFLQNEKMKLQEKDLNSFFDLIKNYKKQLINNARNLTFNQQLKIKQRVKVFKKSQTQLNNRKTVQKILQTKTQHILRPYCFFSHLSFICFFRNCSFVLKQKDRRIQKKI